MRVVLDTNVLFSAIGFSKESPPSQTLELAREGKYEAIVSPFILDELARNLRENLAWDEEALARLRRKFRTTFSIIHPKLRLHVIKRKDSDNRVLECAVAARAAVLVTGDLRDLRPLGHVHGVEILTPREFLQKYFPDL